MARRQYKNPRLKRESDIQEGTDGNGANGIGARTLALSFLSGSSTRLRATSSVVSIALLALALIYWPPLFLCAMLLVMLGGTNELLALTKATHSDLGKYGSLAAFAITGLLWYNAIEWQSAANLGLIVAFALVFSELAMMLEPLKRHPKKRVAANLYASIYIAVPLSLILIVYLEYQAVSNSLGARMLLLLLVPTWAGDIAAYFGGRKYGRTKLAPTISPGKTVEGFLFGFVAAIIATILWRYIALSEIPGMFFSITQTVILGVVIAIFGPIGDLSASVLKREANVKDSGIFLPGHGGILDRFDSLLISGVFYFALCHAIMPYELLHNL